ncbi:unnamed protein product [Arctogadus glacialis]
MSVVENGIVMALICFDQSLKTPKYIAVFNLVFVDVVGSSALVPKVIDTFWFDHKFSPGIAKASPTLPLIVLSFVQVVENSVVMALICFDQSLKTPKYIAVFNLAFVDVLGNSALVPKVIDTFWFDHKLIAITFPLRYQIIVSLKTMFSLVAACWIISIFNMLVAVGLLIRLSFCSLQPINYNVFHLQ